MNTILNWLGTHPELFGFTVATLIYLITILLVSRKLINVRATIFLLIMALITGLIITNYAFIREFLPSKKIETIDSKKLENKTELKSEATEAKTESKDESKAINPLPPLSPAKE